MTMNRRKVLQTLVGTPMAAAFAWSPEEAAAAAARAREARQERAPSGGPYAPRFFSADEFATVAALVDIIIPADERSGSASDVGVPEFIDFMMTDQPARQVAMRGGLRWLDHECRDRFGTTFRECRADQRLQVVDDIAWPDRARPEMSHGARFFSALRDLTATGFFTTRVGIDDLGYSGNRVIREWTGAPPEALDHLGVSYAEVEHWYRDDH